MQCHGLTKKGVRCQKATAERYCHNHRARNQSTRDEAQPRMAPDGTGDPTKTNAITKTKTNTKTKANTNTNVYTNRKPAAIATTPARANNSYANQKHPNAPTSAKLKNYNQQISKEGPVVRVAISPKKTTSDCSPQYATSDKSAAGFIYVYTLSDLLTLSEKPWLMVQNLPSASLLSKQDKWKPFNSKKSKWTFIKVGMTTQSVSQRLRSWEKKCSHSITCLQPNVIYHKMTFLDRFKSLSIKNYQTYRDNGFYCNQARRAETQTHKILRDRFVNIDVQCTGCIARPDGNHKIHVEWFMIRKSELPLVFKVIDQVCSQFL